MWRAVTVLFLATTAVLAQSPLKLFQQEAEKELGRPIVILEAGNEMLTYTGQTFCDQNPVVIKVRAGLPPEVKGQVLAHELGHALLCARGIFIYSRITDKATKNGIIDISGMLSTMIISCYIDPLVDAEAERWGLKTDKLADDLLQRVQTHTKQDAHEWVSQFGELSSAFTAMAIYCADLLPHSFPISDMEKVYEDEPKVIGKLQALRRDLGKPQCNDRVSCYILTQRLRDELGLQSLIVLLNPRTHVFE